MEVEIFYTFRKSEIFGDHYRITWCDILCSNSKAQKSFIYDFANVTRHFAITFSSLLAQKSVTKINYINQIFLYN